MTVPLVFLDTETTGLHADRRPWEIAMIRRDDQGQRGILIQISDVDTSNAELIGLKIGRFHERHLHFSQILTLDDRRLCTYKTEADAAFAVELWTRDAHIVGAVPNFDTECLAAMLRRHGLCPAWHYHLIDIENLAVGYLAGLRTRGAFDTPHGEEALEDKARRLDSIAAITPPWKSDELSRLIGVEPPSEEERHTAMGDALWAMRLYDRIVGADVAAVTE